MAYAVERRQPPGEDYAFWVYLAGLVMLLVAYVSVWSVHRPVAARAPARRGRTGDRVALPSASHASRGRRRRGVRLPRIPGLRRISAVVALPIALATLGLLVIVSTVWMQRRFPSSSIA
jgi:hypothetical protein